LAPLHGLTSRLAPRSDWFGRLRSFTAALEGHSLRERIALTFHKAAKLAGDRLGRARGRPSRRRRDGLYDRYFRAVMGDVPKHFPGRLVLFWPADEPCRHASDPTHGWGEFADGVVDCGSWRPEPQTSPVGGTPTKFVADEWMNSAEDNGGHARTRMPSG